MPFTEEQEAQILQSVSAINTFLQNQQKQAETKPTNETQANSSVLDDAKKAFDEKSKVEQAQSKMEAAIKFNLGIKKFSEDFKNFLPQTTAALIEEVEKKNYSTEVMKADAIRSGIIQSFIELQENMDILPETMKEKAAKFKALTADEKEKQSALFWDVVEVGATQRQLVDKAKAIQKANGTGTNGENAHELRFLSLGDKWKK